MTSSAKPKKYSKNVIQQAEWQMAGVSDFGDILEHIDQRCGTYSFRNLGVYLDEEKVPLKFDDYHLLVELIVNEMPISGTADFDKPMPVLRSINGAFNAMLNVCQFKKSSEAEICKAFLQAIGHYKNFNRKWKNMVHGFLAEHPNTELFYMYRCAANYKDIEQIVVSGHLSVADFKDNLIDYNHIIAHQVGLPSPQDNLRMDRELDHCLCELVSVEFTKAPPSEQSVTAEELQKLLNTTVWDFAEAVERFGL